MFQMQLASNNENREREGVHTLNAVLKDKPGSIHRQDGLVGKRKWCHTWDGVKINAGRMWVKVKNKVMEVGMRLGAGVITLPRVACLPDTFWAGSASLDRGRDSGSHKTPGALGQYPLFVPTENRLCLQGVEAAATHQRAPYPWHPFVLWVPHADNGSHCPAEQGC